MAQTFWQKLLPKKDIFVPELLGQFLEKNVPILI
jgi:hypothetical protein